MTDEQQHRVELILEGMNSKFDLLLEGYATLGRKIERYANQTMENHREMVTMLKHMHDSLASKLDSFGEGVVSHKAGGRIKNTVPGIRARK